MPMFDIESAKKLKLRDCITDAETMVKATGKIGHLDAERCRAGGEAKDLSMVNPSLFRKVSNYCLSGAGQIVIGVSIVLIGAFLLAYLKS